MQSRYKAVAVTVVCFLLTVAFAQDCSEYNFSTGPFPGGTVSYAQHKTGAHTSAFGVYGSASYTGTSACNVTCTASSSDPGFGDSGSLSAIGYHVGHSALKSGIASASGGLGATADTEGAVSFELCLTPNCNFSIGITGGGQGGGFSVTDPPSAIWSDALYYKNACAGETYGGGGGHGCSKLNHKIQYDKDGKILPPQKCHCGCGEPVVIDTLGTGYLGHFTEPNKGVLFDIDGEGNPRRYSWPQPDSGLGWLVLPKHGKVVNGDQLFTDHSPQEHHPSPDPNGLLALGEYDFNRDLVIDKKDKIYSKLRVWIDTHCYKTPNKVCTSAPGELHRLQEVGIYRISLMYSGGTKLDDWGNDFRFWANMNVEGKERQSSVDTRLIYDVYLMQGKK